MQQCTLPAGTQRGHIVSVEPFLSSFSLATVNTRLEKNVVVLHGAIADKDGWFEIQRKSIEWGEWGVICTTDEMMPLPWLT
jgi:hypothetical protein